MHTHCQLQLVLRWASGMCLGSCCRCQLYGTNPENGEQLLVEGRLGLETSKEKAALVHVSHHCSEAPTM